MAGRKRKVTMTDVAREAGCSQSTVSLVLNNVPAMRISEMTRQRVKRAARALGYKVPSGSSTAPGGNGVIYFMVDRLSTSPEAVVSLEGARETAWQNDMFVMAATTLSDRAVEQRAFEYMSAQPVVGIIYASIMTRELAAPAELADVPAVMLNCYAPDRSIPSVVPGEVAGGHSATSRLLRAGHKRVGFINGEEWMEASADRHKGYRQALATYDIPYDPELYRAGDWQLNTGYQHTSSLMAMRDRPTAIFCANDRMAVGAYMALAELGLKIPEDVAIVGYDDEEVAQHLTPQLTTVVLPHREMGRWAVDYLINHRQQPKRKRYPVVKVECQLVERASVGAENPQLAQLA